MEREYVVEITEYAVILLLCEIIFIHTIYRIFIHHWKQRLTNTNSISNIVLTLCGMSGFITNLILQIIFLCIDRKLDTLSEMANAISITFLFGGQCCVHLLFINRLHSVFKQTKYKISNCVLISFYSMTFIFFLNWVAYSIFHALLHFNVTNRNTTEILYATFEWNGAFMDLVLCSMLLYLFISRLFLVSISENDEWIENQTTYKLLPILNIIARYFILTTISMIIVQTTLILVALIDTDEIIFKREMYPPLYISVFWYIYPIQSLVSVYCLALNFHFSKHLYMCLCGWVHKCCVTALMKRAKSNIINNTEYQLLVHDGDQFM
eukprot:479629_1